MRAALLLLAILLAGCGPSCAEQGGHEVFDGYVYMPQFIGKSIVLLPYAQTHCELNPRRPAAGTLQEKPVIPSSTPVYTGVKVNQPGDANANPPVPADPRNGQAGGFMGAIDATRGNVRFDADGAIESRALSDLQLL